MKVRSILPMLALTVVSAMAQQPENAVANGKLLRARDLGIPFDGTPGALNAITDVKGVEVGMSTLIQGDGALVVGKGPVRTGLTVIFPRGKTAKDSVMAATAELNGNGEMTGTHWINESGFMQGAMAITNTHSVGVVRDSIIAWQGKTGYIPLADLYNDDLWASLPVVAETADVPLNDMNGFHVKPDDVFAAMNSASSGPVPEGNVGGGTGMICFGWKCGTGTASRKLPDSEGAYTVGVLVQANFGAPANLTIAGVPVGRELSPPPMAEPKPDGSGSIIVVVATDAPLLPMQLRRLAKRAALGVGRMGGLGEDSSGDLMLAFSTANPGAVSANKIATVQMIPNDELNPLFAATEEATEEAIVNAMVAAKTMTGANNITVQAIPHAQLQQVLRKYNRLVVPQPPAQPAPTPAAPAPKKSSR
ncbi:MAG TPA: P1 family peptidase [Terriglobales bacterium]|nr:P1 family peptidase [Terriglobales bacterium]